MTALVYSFYIIQRSQYKSMFAPIVWLMNSIESNRIQGILAQQMNRKKSPVFGRMINTSFNWNTSFFLAKSEKLNYDQLD